MRDVGGQAGRDGVRVARLDAVVELLAQAGAELVDQLVARGTRRPTRCATRRRGRAPRAPRGRRAPTRRCRAVAPSPRRVNRRAASPGTPGRSTRRRPGASRSAANTSRAARRAPPRAARRCRRAAAGRTWSWSSDELGRGVRRDEVGAGRQHLPELHEHPAALLEREPQAPDRRAGAGGLDILLAAEPERRPEPVAHRDAGDLRVALDLAARAGGPSGSGAGPTAGRSGPGRSSRDGPGTRATPPRPSHRTSENRKRLRAKLVRRGWASAAIHSATTTPMTQPAVPETKVAANERRTPSTRPMSALATSAKTNAGTSSQSSSPRRSKTDAASVVVMERRAAVRATAAPRPRARRRRTGRGAPSCRTCPRSSSAPRR